MTDSIKDENRIKTILALSNEDGITPSLVSANPTNHGLSADDNTTGSDLSGDIASRDENRVPVLMAVSAVDGVTPVAVYVDPATNKLLIRST